MQLQDHCVSASLAVGDSAALPVDQRLIRWQAYAKQQRGDTLDTIKARLLEQAPAAQGLSEKALQLAIRRQLGAGLIHDLLQDCAQWRGEKHGAVNPERSAMISAALGGALAYLIPSDAAAITPATGPQLYRWLIPSLGGGLFGVLLLGSGDIGGVLSALLGSVGGVAGVAWLANHPEFLSDPIRAAGGDGPSPTRALPFPRLAWLQRPGHWLLNKVRQLARRLAAWLVALVLPPPVTAATLPRAFIATAGERAFDLLTALVFVCCTAAAERGASANPDDANLPITEGSVLRALLALVRSLDRQPADQETVRGLTEELHQRLQDAGYAWEVLPDGTRFEDDHRKRFQPFGLVATGEPVETLEPCFRRGDAILLPGRITKQRG